MVYSKSALFNKELQEMASLFKVLSHPARIEILRYLAETKTCITGDISNELPLSRTTVNQHLKELKDAGLVKGRIDGSKVKYCLNNSRIKELDLAFGDFMKLLNDHPDNQC
jgi:DNA-binding transcriptional ArsR family regulator